MRAFTLPLQGGGNYKGGYKDLTNRKMKEHSICVFKIIYRRKTTFLKIQAINKYMGVYIQYIYYKKYMLTIQMTMDGRVWCA